MRAFAVYGLVEMDTMHMYGLPDGLKLNLYVMCDKPRGTPLGQRDETGMKRNHLVM